MVGCQKTIFQKGSDAARTWKGKKLSEEHKQNISNSLKGRIVSEETKEKLRIAHPKKELSNEQLNIVKNLIAEGKTLTKIQEITGMERHFISQELKRLGIKSSITKSSEQLFKEQFNIIKKLLSERKSLTTINKITGIDRHFLSKELQKLKLITAPVVKNNEELFNKQLDIIKNLLSENKSVREIQEITGIGRHFISKELKRLGLK